MSRNGSGTMSVVNTFVAGNTITAAGHIQNNTDIANEITNSMAADGQTIASAPLKHSSGTFAAPSVTFGADTDTGIFRNAANEIGFAAGGSLVMQVGTATATFAFDVLISGHLVASATATFSSQIWGANGTVSLPALAFASDTDTGLYRIGANNIGVAANGAKVLDITTTGLSVTGTLSSTSSFSASSGTLSGNAILTTASVADQAAEEAATSITVYTSPGRQQHHPGHPKAWAEVTISGGTPSIAAGYNFTSVTDNGVGNTTLNLTTGFSSATYAVVATMFNTTLNQGYMIEVTAISASAIQVRTGSLGVSGANTTFAAADISFFVAAYGDQ